MNYSLYSKILGTGSYIPERNIKNIDFSDHTFYDENGSIIDKSNDEIIDKFNKITTINERKHINNDQLNSDIAYLAAESALKSSDFNPEELDYIIVAHNFGDIKQDIKRVDTVPSIAARVKYKLKIKNPFTVAYDLIFGCPGWLQAVIQANYFIKSGDAKNILIIGSDVLSRVSDPHDRDSMLYADGAGAVILQAIESETPTGILSHLTRTDTLIHSKMLHMDISYNKELQDNNFFLKMNGRKLYQYALETVPETIRQCLNKCDTHLSEIKKVLIHQANGKMDESILMRLYKLYGITKMPEDIMPMTIGWLGNSSVATLPTLLDLILKGKLQGHNINKGDKVLFASVGAGMSINAVVYKM